MTLEPRTPAVTWCLRGVPLLLTIMALLLALSPSVGATERHHQKAPHPGLGATVAAWKAAYHRSSGCDDNSCFGPAWTHQGSGLRYKYGEVTLNKGRIDSYNEAFPPHTSATVALNEILATLPGTHAGPITVVAPSGDNDGCGQVSLTSATVAKELGRDDPTGQVGIELEYITSNGSAVYSADNVQLALVLATNDEAGSC